MPFPVIEYNASTGSDTAPTGADGSGVNGDWSGTTVTLNETVDLTGVADDGGSDYLWYDGVTGNRHMASISAFNPSVAACTSLTTVQSASGAETGKNWAVNGIRQTFENDTGRPDWDDPDWGWTYELDAGTYVCTSRYDPGDKAGAPSTNEEFIYIRAKSGAASRPVIQQNSNNNIVYFNSADLWFEGIELSNGDSASTLSYIYGGVGNVTFRDCVIDSAGKSAYCIYVVFSGGTSINIFDCYITGGNTFGIWTATQDINVTMVGSVLDGQAGAYFATIGIWMQNAADMACTFLNNLIYDCGGVGIRMTPNGTGATCNVIGNTIVDNGNHGCDQNGTSSIYGWSMLILNNVICYNGGYGLTNATTASDGSRALIDYNFMIGNTSGDYNGDWAQGANGVTLSADPFTNRASDDYTLNNTAGGGAAVREVGFPAEDDFPDGT